MIHWRILQRILWGAGIVMMFPALAHAGNDLSSMASWLGEDAKGINTFLTALAFAFGFILIGWGLFSFIRREGSPKHAGMMLVGGGLLLALGWTLGVILGTFGFGIGGTLDNGAGGGGGGVPLLDDFRKHIGNFWAPALLIIRVAGLGFLIYGIVGLVSSASPRASVHLKHAVASMLIGSVLFNAEPFIDAMSQSLVGKESEMMNKRNFDYASSNVGGGSAQAKSALMFAYAVIAVVGLIGFVSGVNGLRKSANAQSNETVGGSLTKIIGGSLAMNLPQFIAIFGLSTTDQGFIRIVKFLTGS